MLAHAAPEFADLDNPAQSAADAGREGWLHSFETAYSDAADLSRTSVPAEGQELAVAAWPLVETACLPVGERLLAMASEGLLAGDHLPAIYQALTAGLWRNLFTIMSRTMVLELATAQKSGLLDGNDDYETFAAYLADPEFAQAVLAQHPRLSELLVTVTANWSEATSELLDRLRADHAALSSSAVISISASQGDTHRHGRSVAIIGFEDGSRVVYKPRPLAAETAFAGFADWFNRRTGEDLIAHVDVVDRGGYGWCAFAVYEEAKGNSGIRRYYRRLGALIAVARVLGLTDLHFENLVAAGEHPVVVDLETLFHPASGTLFAEHHPTAADAALSRIADTSAAASGLLPIRVPLGGETGQMNIAGMADVEGLETPFEVAMWEAAGTGEMRMIKARQRLSGHENLPAENGKRVGPEQHRAAVLAGFRTAYRILLDARDELISKTGPLSAFANLPVRVVLRPTQRYLDILGHGVHPQLLADPDARKSWIENALPVEGRFARLSAPRISEMAALERGDVPVFETTPSSTDLIACDGRTWPGVLPVSGMDAAQELIAGLGTSDLNRQLALIDAALMTAETAPKSRKVDMPRLATSLVEKADAIARRAVRGICDAAIVADGTAAWFTLIEGADGTLVSKEATLDLYSGLPGIALLLSQAGVHLDDAGARQTAHAAVRSIVAHVENGDHRTLPVGGHAGLGGLAFALDALAPLHPDLPVDGALRNVLETIAGAELADAPLDAISGIAGAILALETVSAASDLRSKLVDALCDRIEIGTADNALSIAGMAHGLAGLRLALSRNAKDNARARSALESIEPGTGTDGCACHADPVTWCGGRSGMLLADGAGKSGQAATIVAALKSGACRDDSLCHGSLGALLALKESGAISAENLRDLTHSVLDSIEIRAPRCGTIGGAFSPALMDGMAGVGFAALALTREIEIPSPLSFSNGA
jgi:type 2 lantibiotic biosynthesis protein LanM